ncbi:unnamed protein product [Rhizoctonia solani]|uniref:Uncharacterized protein n=1 Tax=Rhizoctonia solani TaxID=456999 RepID=A0A8H3D258_9AGAM|nr:unnamed protein product [Rhizoctonia solani]
MAWIALGSSLQKLKDNPGVFSRLSVAAGILLECFDGIEMAARNQEDYEILAKEFKGITESLVESNMASTPPLISKCMSNITSEIERRADEIKNKRGRGEGVQFWFAKADEEDVMERYRRVKSLFRQLQAYKPEYEHMEHYRRAPGEHTVEGSKTGEGCNVRLEAIGDC